MSAVNAGGVVRPCKAQHVAFTASLEYSRASPHVPGISLIYNYHGAVRVWCIQTPFLLLTVHGRERPLRGDIPARVPGMLPLHVWGCAGRR